MRGVLPVNLGHKQANLPRPRFAVRGSPWVQAKVDREKVAKRPRKG